MEEIFIQFENDSMREKVRRKFSNLINKYKQLSDEDKEKFQKGAIDTLTNALKKVPEKIQPHKAFFPSWFMLYNAYIPFIFATSCVTLLFVVGVCGVYRYIWKRKQRHIEKKKLKQEKAKLRNAKKKKQ